MDEDVKSPEKSGSGDAPQEDDSSLNRLESQKVTVEQGRSDIFNVAEKLLSPGGAQIAKEGNNSYRKEFFFFNSVDHISRHNKRHIILRPRIKTQNKNGLSSPNSVKRPKKRARDTRDFNFDLVWI
ncbi:hypothetical protein Hanom_Chr01g00079331 [Helianthus anomalus]